jgi:fatty-acyl-CoA synthase
VPLSESWATLWEAIADAQPEHTAVVIGDTPVKWHDLDERAARLASALSELGVGPGGTVAQLLYTSPEYLEAIYAAFKLRATPMNVNYRYLADEVAYVLGDGDASVVIVHSSLVDRVLDVRDRLPALRAVVVVDDDGAPMPEGTVAYESLVASYQPAPRIERSGDDELLMYTGGTTGLPKGVVWSHEGLFGALAFPGYVSMGLPVPETPEEVSRIAHELEVEGRHPVNLCAAPLMHGTGQFLAMSTFVMGGTLVLLGERRYDAHELLRLVERWRVTQLSIVGDAFAKPIVAALEEAERAGRPYDVSSLQRVVSTGATFSAEAKRGIMARQPVAVVDMIGASEGGPYGTALTPPGTDPLDTAVFKATAATTLFDDATWEKIPFGTDRVGVLAVTGPMPKGYRNDPAKTERTFRVIDGARYTVPGDYARIDADVTVHLLGRGAVCINTGGEKVYPEEVEVVVRSVAGVVDALVVGVPDERFGQAVTALVAAEPGTEISADAVVAAVRGQLAGYKAPRHVVVVPEIYRSPSGKADYRWAQARAIEGLSGTSTADPGVPN